jgi:hypothetical protein
VKGTRNKVCRRPWGPQPVNPPINPPINPLLDPSGNGGVGTSGRRAVHGTGN